jgi:hypothetical protein
MTPSGDSYIETVTEFGRVLRSDDLIGPALAVRLALVVKSVGTEQGLGLDEQAGIITGAPAMYRVLTGRPQ